MIISKHPNYLVRISELYDSIYKLDVVYMLGEGVPRGVLNPVWHGLRSYLRSQRGILRTIFRRATQDDLDAIIKCCEQAFDREVRRVDRLMRSEYDFVWRDDVDLAWTLLRKEIEDKFDQAIQIMRDAVRPGMRSGTAILRIWFAIRKRRASLRPGRGALDRFLGGASS